MDDSCRNAPERNQMLILLAFVLLVGTGLRLYGLGDESIWLDEAVSVKIASTRPVEIFTLKETNPPLYYLVLHYWTQWFGDSEFSVRFPSVIFGVMSILVIYRVGRLIFNDATGIIGALVLACSEFHIQYAQEARTYGLLTLLTLVSFYFFIHLFRQPTRPVWIGYLIFASLLTYSHIYGWFVIISQNFCFFIFWLLSKKPGRVEFLKWTGLQAAILLLYLPWAHILVIQCQKVNQEFWILPPTQYTVLNTFIEYSGTPLLFICFGLLVLFSFFRIEKHHGHFEWKNALPSADGFQWHVRFNNAEVSVLLLLWLLTPIVLPFIVSRIMTPIYFSRYTIVSSPALYLLVAKGIVVLFRARAPRILCICLIVLLSVLPLRRYYPRILKEQWRDTAHFVEAHAHAGDLILFNTGFTMLPFDYYSKRSDLEKIPLPPIGQFVDFDKKDASDCSKLLAIMKNHHRIWVIYSYPQKTEKCGLMSDMLKQEYNVVEQKNYLGIEIKKYESGAVSKKDG